MPLEGHWQRQRTPVGSAPRRERRVLIALGCLLAAAALVVVIAATHGGPTTARGCVDITVASTTGGANIHACGARAAAMPSVSAPTIPVFGRVIARTRESRSAYCLSIVREPSVEPSSTTITDATCSRTARTKAPIARASFKHGMTTTQFAGEFTPKSYSRSPSCPVKSRNLPFFLQVGCFPILNKIICASVQYRLNLRRDV